MTDTPASPAQVLAPPRDVLVIVSEQGIFLIEARQDDVHPLLRIPVREGAASSLAPRVLAGLLRSIRPGRILLSVRGIASPEALVGPVTLALDSHADAYASTVVWLPDLSEVASALAVLGDPMAPKAFRILERIRASRESEPPRH